MQMRDRALPEVAQCYGMVVVFRRVAVRHYEHSARARANLFVRPDQTRTRTCHDRKSVDPFASVIIVA